MSVWRGRRSTEQSSLLSTLSTANASFSTARRGDTSSKDREQALQSLENAYFAYKEIVQNLDVGRRFYNDLAGIVTKFRDEAVLWAAERRREAGALEGEIVNALVPAVGGLSVGGGGGAGEQQLQQQGQRQQRELRQHHQQPQRGTRLSTAQAQTNGHGHGHASAAAAQQPSQPPTSTTTTAPVAMTASPVPSVPQNRAWTEDMPINFAPKPKSSNNNASPAAIPQTKDARWDPSKGLKFG